MKNIRRQLAAAASKIAARLEAAEGGQEPRSDGPEFSADTIHYEIGERNHAITCGGIGAMHQLANQVGLIEALNLRLGILKRRRPYSESDHIPTSCTTRCVVGSCSMISNCAATTPDSSMRSVPEPSRIQRPRVTTVDDSGPRTSSG